VSCSGQSEKNKVPLHGFNWRGLCAVCVLLVTGSAAASMVCFERAAQRHGIAPEVLRAIAQQESAMNPMAVNRNRDGSMDIGLMQINSLWLPTLARYGIERAMLWEPCTNVDVGAWILAANFRRYGVNWNGLGAYNAGSAPLRLRYARQVVARLRVARPPVMSPVASSAESETSPSETLHSTAPSPMVLPAPFSCESSTVMKEEQC
jgi:Transglycosylase SLT domain